MSALTGKLRSLQVLRAVAALGVVFCHGTDRLGPNRFYIGAAGVDLFFVISGFIISRVMVGREPVAFAKDRLWRIFPIYWLCAMPWFLHAFAAGESSPARTIASLTLWPIIGAYQKPYLPAAWTLYCELMFYVAATVALVTKRGWLVIASYFVCLVGGFLLQSSLLSFVGNPLVLEFMFGLLIARLPLNRAVGATLAIAGIVVGSFAPDALVLNALTFGSMSVARLLWLGLPAAAIVYGALSFERSFRRTVWTPLVFLGDASYSLYLTHMVLTRDWAPWPVGVAASIAVGSLVHVYAERPILNWRRKRSGHDDGEADRGHQNVASRRLTFGASLGGIGLGRRRDLL